MTEYKALGHMQEVRQQTNDRLNLFLPHYHVLRESSVTTKLRVVFDGSMKTTSGLSVNDIQNVGKIM